MSSANLSRQFTKKHPNLACIFKKHWNTSLSKYTEQLYQKPSFPIENELLEAFQEEWQDTGFTREQIDEATQQLIKTSTIQTSHHVTPTNGPTFLSLDIICLTGLVFSDYYLVGANSGVSFSNVAWSGALSFGDLPLGVLLKKSSKSYSQAIKAAKERRVHGDNDSRISLIPSKQRDQLVYGTNLTTQQIELFSDFEQPLKAILPDSPVKSAYSHWAVNVCSAIQNSIFNTNKILYFDINRVIRRYLLKILSSEKDHAIKQLFHSQTPESTIIWKAFNLPSPLLSNYRGKKSSKVDHLYWDHNYLTGTKRSYRVESIDKLYQLLSDDHICPGVFIVFLVLKFLNGIRCLGSFNQIEYLENYRKTWQQLDLNWKLDLSDDIMNSLTSGRLLVDNRPVWPLDLFMKQEQLSIEEFSSWKLGKLWEPIVNQLSK